jgi:hypothetical protein
MPKNNNLFNYYLSIPLLIKMEPNIIVVLADNSIKTVSDLNDLREPIKRILWSVDTTKPVETPNDPLAQTEDSLNQSINNPLSNYIINSGANLNASLKDNLYNPEFYSSINIIGKLQDQKFYPNTTIYISEPIK